MKTKIALIGLLLVFALMPDTADAKIFGRWRARRGGGGGGNNTPAAPVAPADFDTASYQQPTLDCPNGVCPTCPPTDYSATALINSPPAAPASAAPTLESTPAPLALAVGVEKSIVVPRYLSIEEALEDVADAEEMLADAKAALRDAVEATQQQAAKDAVMVRAQIELLEMTSANAVKKLKKQHAELQDLTQADFE